mgnify:CR=1 FL=1
MSSSDYWGKEHMQSSQLEPLVGSDPSERPSRSKGAASRNHKAYKLFVFALCCAAGWVLAWQLHMASKSWHAPGSHEFGWFGESFRRCVQAIANALYR